MKIALVSVAPPYRGGISLNSALLARYLSKSHNITVYNFIRQYPDFLFPGKTQYEEGEPAVPISTIRVIDSVNPLSWFRTANHIIRENPEILIIRYWHPFFAPAYRIIAARVRHKLPAVRIIAVCDNIVPHESHWYDNLLTKWFFRKVDAYIVMSSEVENDLKSLVTKPVYRKIFHPVYHVFGEIKNQSEARNRLGIYSRHVILYFGLVRDYKGMDTLIRAAGILKNELEDFTIIAVGEAYGKAEKYNELIRRLDVGDVFRWVNEYTPDNEVKWYFSAADVVALPYRTATQSGIVPIAYHFNRPVVVTRVGGLPEVVDDGVTGFIVPPDNPEMLAEKLKTGCETGEFLRMSKNIPRFKEKFSWENFVIAIEKLAEK